MQVIGVDIGGTTIKLGCVQDGLNIVYRDRRFSPRDPAQMAQAVFDMVQTARKRFPNAPVGISCAGSMDGGGYVTAGQLGWFNAPLGELIEQLFGEPIPMDNDAMCALYAEAAYGVLKDCSTGILVTFGTGIGGGIITENRPLRGHGGLHGEIGHMLTHAGGRPCSCGQIGCWEAYAAASVLRQMAGGMPVKEVISRVRAGELADVWHAYLHEVALGLASLMMIFAPEIIAIGGGLSNAGDIVIDGIRQAVQDTASFQIFNPFTRIESATFQNDAGILGAAALAEMEFA